MAKESYIPQPGSLADRVCRFLQANPREELDVTDMVSKFGVVQRAIEPGLEAPMRHGLVVKGNDGAGSRLWKAGPKLAELGLAIPTIKQIGSPPPAPPPSPCLKRPSRPATRSRLPNPTAAAAATASPCPTST
jgi:hypothetical protein